MAGLTKADLTQGSELSVSDDGKFTVRGSGVFDDLMEAVTEHLTAQFNLGRLQGSDYAKVYSASLQSATNGAVSFLTGKVDADLLAAQIEKTNSEVTLLTAQTAKVEAEVILAQAKNAADIELIDAQIALTVAQQSKIDSEKALLDAKTITEKAQAQNAPTVGSVLAAQIEVFEEQAKGFYWNAKRNWAKLTVDAASVDASQGEGFTNAYDNSLSDRNSARPVQSGG